MLINMTHRRNDLALVLTPSWLSGLVAAVASLAVVVTTVALLYYNGSSLQFIQQSQANTSSTVSQNYEESVLKLAHCVGVSYL